MIKNLTRLSIFVLATSPFSAMGSDNYRDNENNKYEESRNFENLYDYRDSQSNKYEESRNFENLDDYRDIQSNKYENSRIFEKTKNSKEKKIIYKDDLLKRSSKNSKKADYNCLESSYEKVKEIKEILSNNNFKNERGILIFQKKLESTKLWAYLNKKEKKLFLSKVKVWSKKPPETIKIIKLKFESYYSKNCK